MTVGFFSPLPPARSGVADHSAELLRALQPLGAVRVNARDADVPLYHLGNNPLHREIYGHALANPGVTVLHDAVLHHFFLGRENEREYIAEFVYNYGHWSEDLARELWRTFSRSAADPEYFRYPMIRRVVERSRAVIVHDPRAAALVHEHVRGTTVHEIPLLFTLPDDLPFGDGSHPVARRTRCRSTRTVPGRRLRPSARVQAVTARRPHRPEPKPKQAR